MDLLPEVFIGQTQTHTPGIGPASRPRNEMESSGQRVPLSTSSPRPNRNVSCSEKMPLMVEEIVSTLRMGVYLSEA